MCVSAYRMNSYSAVLQIITHMHACTHAHTHLHMHLPLQVTGHMAPIIWPRDRGQMVDSQSLHLFVSFSANDIRKVVCWLLSDRHVVDSFNKQNGSAPTGSSSVAKGYKQITPL